MVYLDGLIAGIVGAAVIAIWFLFLDTVSGLPFYAPPVLGTALFLGPEDLASTEGVQLSLKLTLMYSCVGLCGAGWNCGASPFIDWKESQSCLLLIAFCDSGIWICRHRIRFC